jgi:hypothetical protein
MSRTHNASNPNNTTQPRQTSTGIRRHRRQVMRPVVMLVNRDSVQTNCGRIDSMVESSSNLVKFRCFNTSSARFTTHLSLIVELLETLLIVLG